MKSLEVKKDENDYEDSYLHIYEKKVELKCFGTFKELVVEYEEEFARVPHHTC